MINYNNKGKCFWLGQKEPISGQVKTHMREKLKPNTRGIFGRLNIYVREINGTLNTHYREINATLNTRDREINGTFNTHVREINGTFTV